MQAMSLSSNLIIMGKSLGAKVAVELAKEVAIKKLILLGYPFTFQSGKIRSERVRSINDLIMPVHIIQGECDKYGRRSIIDTLALKSDVNINWIGDVDHNYYLEGQSEIESDHLELLRQYLLKTIC